MENKVPEYGVAAPGVNYVLRPGGYAVITTPRLQRDSKLFYTLFADLMNFAYRELMDVTHLGRYAYENGFEILRHGRIRAHNGIIARAR